MTATSYAPYRLDGKVALVTGSGRGIGAAIAVELGRLGAKVVINYANAADSAEKVVEEIKGLGSDAIAFKADIRQVPQTAKLMDDAVAHFGGLDIVCSNSGVVSFGHLGDVTEVSILVHNVHNDHCPRSSSQPPQLRESAIIERSLLTFFMKHYLGRV